VRFHKKQFLILSAAVYGAVCGTCTNTERKKAFLVVRSGSSDKTFVKLPAPAYYAVDWRWPLALALTGLAGKWDTREDGTR